MKVIDRIRGDKVVVPTMRANAGWKQVSTNIHRDIPISGAMGKASDFALGLCLSQPGTKVIVFDGDGSIIMNLGALITIANKAPRNLYHFVMDNGVYGTTGGQPVPGNGVTSYAGLAREAGYAGSYEFDDLEEFATQAEGILDQPGPVLVSIKTVPDIRTTEERIATRSSAGRTLLDAVADLRSQFATR